MPGLVQIHRLGNSVANMTCGCVLRDVGLRGQGEKVGLGSLWVAMGGDQLQKVGLGAIPHEQQRRHGRITLVAKSPLCLILYFLLSLHYSHPLPELLCNMVS